MSTHTQEPGPCPSNSHLPGLQNQARSLCGTCSHRSPMHQHGVPLGMAPELVSQSPQRAGDLSPPPVVGSSLASTASQSPEPPAREDEPLQSSVHHPVLPLLHPANQRSHLPILPQCCPQYRSGLLSPCSASIPNITQVAQGRAPQRPFIGWHRVRLLLCPSQADLGLPGMGSQGLGRDNEFQAFRLFGKLASLTWLRWLFACRSLLRLGCHPLLARLLPRGSPHPWGRCCPAPSLYTAEGSGAVAVREAGGELRNCIL